jgi:uncharacterized protein (TIGR03067 family)
MRRNFVATLLVALMFPSFCWSADGKDGASDTDGTWLAAAAELGGKNIPETELANWKLVLKGADYTFTAGKESDRGTVKRNTSAKPMAMDITGTEGPNKGKTILAIYEVDGDTLKVCYDLSGKARPVEFQTKAETPLFLVTYKRQKR